VTFLGQKFRTCCSILFSTGLLSSTLILRDPKQLFAVVSVQLLFCECLCVHCSQLEHDAWLARERVAQAEFQKKREHEETILREREEREVCGV